MLRVIWFGLASLSSLVAGFHQNRQSPCSLTCLQLSEDSSGVVVGDQASRNLWSLNQADVEPACRIQPQSPQDIANILAAVRLRSCHFAVLGGGTSPFKGASNAEDGITIDLGLLNSIELLNETSPKLKVGAGNVWQDVYRYLGPRGLYAVGTRNSLTGVVGSILGGGISFFSQRHGCSCDNVVEFEVVLANGTILVTTEEKHSDLFWALRGGGNNFGVVTSVTIDVFRDPPSWYALQRWDITIMESVFNRLYNLTVLMPKNMWMLATTLAWNPRNKTMIITERTLWSEMPDLPKALASGTVGEPTEESQVLEQVINQRDILDISMKMDRWNPAGFYNFFGSFTFKNDVETSLAVAQIFKEEVVSIKSAEGLQVYIVYNPLTVGTILAMSKRGGNALGLKAEDGPLIILNINLHWSNINDESRMRTFMRRMIERIQKAAESRGTHHLYRFQNHAFEEQDIFQGYGTDSFKRLKEVRKSVDPDGVFQRLQPGYFKLDLESADSVANVKSEL